MSRIEDCSDLANAGCPTFQETRNDKQEYDLPVV